MTHIDYITKHLLFVWVQQWTNNFRMWADLITGNYEGYTLSEEEDPYQECYEWFWLSINLDETCSKEFIEELIRRSKEPVYPFNPFDDDHETLS